MRLAAGRPQNGKSIICHFSPSRAVLSRQWLGEVADPPGQYVRSGGQYVRSGGQYVRSGGHYLRSGGQYRYLLPTGCEESEVLG